MQKIIKEIHGQSVLVTICPPQRVPANNKGVLPMGHGSNGISWEYWEQPTTEAKATFQREQKKRCTRLANKRAIKLEVTRLFDEQHSITDIMEMTGKSETYIRTVLFGYKVVYRKG
jgi:hypothetical protein